MKINRNIRILIAGDWKYDIYEQALFDGFIHLGITPLKFSFSEYLKYPDVSALRTLLLHRKQIEIVNKKLEEYSASVKPGLVFIQRPFFISPETIKKIKNISAVKIFGFHNDNPFANIKAKLKNYNYINSLKYYDTIFVYRPSNLNDVKKITVKPVKILKPYYVHGMHKRYGRASKIIDVIFVGHSEKIRQKFCKGLILNNIDLKVYGPGWRTDDVFTKNKNIFDPINSVDYAALLNRSKIALAFLSKKNKDIYTRRNFEITACGTFMLSERTPELKEIFIEGKECDYFSSEEELLDKVKFYLKNSSVREKIALAGYNKCIKTRNSNIDRARELLQHYASLN